MLCCTTGDGGLAAHWTEEVMQTERGEGTHINAK